MWSKDFNNQTELEKNFSKYIYTQLLNTHPNIILY